MHSSEVQMALRGCRPWPLHDNRPEWLRLEAHGSNVRNMNTGLLDLLRAWAEHPRIEMRYHVVDGKWAVYLIHLADAADPRGQDAIRTLSTWSTRSLARFAVSNYRQMVEDAGWQS